MNYRVVISPQAQKQMNKLAHQMWTRVNAVLQRLSDNPRPPGSLKVQSKPGYRVRVGDYRVIYEVNDRARIVDVKSVLHRKDAYS